MKLGLQLGYWGGAPSQITANWRKRPKPPDSIRSSPPRPGALTPTHHWPGGARRPRASGWAPSVLQLSARTPTACAMAALTLDHLSGGPASSAWAYRTAGRRRPASPSQTAGPDPRVHRHHAKGLGREEPVTNDGPHYPLPLTGEGTSGLGKPPPIVHPLRSDIPIFLGAEGPKNIALNRRDRGRLAADLLTRRDWPTCTTVARRGICPAGCATQPG